MARVIKVDRAVAALLTSASIADASAKSGVPLRTLFRWMRDDDFRQELREARQRAFEAALGRISYAASEAVDTLLGAMRGQNTTRIQFWAARAVLDLAATIHEGDTLARVERIEKAIKQQPDSRPMAPDGKSD